MRVKNSCRFTQYHKVEVWNPKMMVWTPIQRSHPTPEAAIEAAPKGQFRVITFSDDGEKKIGQSRIK